MCTSVPFAAGIGKPPLYFISDYVISIHMSLGMHIALGYWVAADFIKQAYQWVHISKYNASFRIPIYCTIIWEEYLLMGNQGKDWTLWLLILLLHYTEWSDSSVYHGALVSQAQAQSRTRRQFQDEFFQPSFLTIATTLTSTLPYLALPLLPAHCPGEGGWVLTCGREYGER